MVNTKILMLLMTIFFKWVVASKNKHAVHLFRQMSIMNVFFFIFIINIGHVFGTCNTDNYLSLTKGKVYGEQTIYMSTVTYTGTPNIVSNILTTEDCRNQLKTEFKDLVLQVYIDKYKRVKGFYVEGASNDKLPLFFSDPNNTGFQIQNHLLIDRDDNFNEVKITFNPNLAGLEFDKNNGVGRILLRIPTSQNNSYTTIFELSFPSSPEFTTPPHLPNLWGSWGNANCNDFIPFARTNKVYCTEGLYSQSWRDWYDITEKTIISRRSDHYSPDSVTNNYEVIKIKLYENGYDGSENWPVKGYVYFNNWKFDGFENATEQELDDRSYLLDMVKYEILDDFEYLEFYNDDGTQTQVFYKKETCFNEKTEKFEQCDYMISSFNYRDFLASSSTWERHEQIYGAKFGGSLPFWARLPHQTIRMNVRSSDPGEELTNLNITSEFTYFSYNLYTSSHPEGYNVSIWKAYEARENRNSRYTLNNEPKISLENRFYCGDRAKYMVMHCHYSDQVSIIALNDIWIDYTVDGKSFTKQYATSIRGNDGSQDDYLDHKKSSPDANLDTFVTSVRAKTLNKEDSCAPALTKEMVLRRAEDMYEPPKNYPGKMTHNGRVYFPGCTLDDNGTPDDISDDIISEEDWIYKYSN